MRVAGFLSVWDSQSLPRHFDKPASDSTSAFFFSFLGLAMDALPLKHHLFPLLIFLTCAKGAVGLQLPPHPQEQRRAVPPKRFSFLAALAIFILYHLCSLITYESCQPYFTSAFPSRIYRRSLATILSLSFFPWIYSLRIKFLVDSGRSTAWDPHPFFKCFQVRSASVLEGTTPEFSLFF